MDDAVLHERLDAIAGDAGVLAAAGDPALDALERHASSGCSRCARALVNAREGAVLLAAAGGAVTPGAALWARILGSARQHAGAGGFAARRGEAARIRDASATVAHLHMGGPDEAAREREVDALDALTERPGDGCTRALVELERLLEYPILFISVVRGERVGYRAQRGLTGALRESRQIRREMTFCTHCVNGGVPLVVEDAAREPFFRGSKMVQRFSIRAYLGVPLRTSAGLAIGTVCAMDTAPRRAEPEAVRILELYAEPVAAEIERLRDDAAAARRDGLVERAEDGAAIYAASWFARLLDVELARVAWGRMAALITLRGEGARAAASLAGPGEVVGRAPGEPEALGVLLSGAASRAAAARCEALRAACPGAAFALAERGDAAPVWWSRASASSGPVPA